MADNIPSIQDLPIDETVKNELALTAKTLEEIKGHIQREELDSALNKVVTEIAHVKATRDIIVVAQKHIEREAAASGTPASTESGPGDDDRVDLSSVEAAGAEVSNPHSR